MSDEPARDQARQEARQQAKRDARSNRAMFAFVPPLLIVPFIAYNVVAFLFLGGDPQGWNRSLLFFTLPSGGTWAISAGDLIVVLSLGLLVVELIKSSRLATISVREQLFSGALFIVMLVEWLFVGAAASSAFVILMMMSALDVAAGFVLPISAARRWSDLAR